MQAPNPPARPFAASPFVPRRGVEPLRPIGQTGLSRPRIPFRHPGRDLEDSATNLSLTDTHAVTSGNYSDFETPSGM